MKKGKLKPALIVTLLSVLWIGISLYVTHMEINIKNFEFITWFVITAAAIYMAVQLFILRSSNLSFSKQPSNGKFVEFNAGKSAKKVLMPVIILVSLAVAYFVIANVSSATIFRAKSYANQLNLEHLSKEQFGDTITPKSIESGTLPIIDKDISKRLAEGKISTYGSQYTISDTFTLINIKENGKERLVRVAPLEYSNFFVSLNRYNEGSIGYVMVDAVTEEAKLVEVKGGMPFIQSGLLNKKLERYIWMRYPTALVKDYSFEIDDNGTPFWVATCYDYKVGIIGGEDPVGVITVNATTGETQKYNKDKVPTWVDRVVPVDVAYAQADKALTYKNGWFNANFGERKDVFKLEEEYNYICLDGKTYLYAGVSSPTNADQSAVGFVLVDLYSKEAKMYNIQGITLNRAMEIAKNHQKVKAQALTPTVPILVNVEGEPTYFMILKNGYQRQWYVMIRVSDGTVALNQNLKDTKNEYISLILNQGGGTTSEKVLSKNGTVSRLHLNESTGIVEFLLTGEPDKIYSAPLKLGASVKFMRPGDAIQIKYVESSDGSATVREIKNTTIQ